MKAVGQQTRGMATTNRHIIMAGLPWSTAMTHQYAHRVKHGLVATLALAMLLVGSSTVHAQGRVFYDNFEANNTDQWSFEYSKCIPAARGADGGNPHTGAFMAKCNWNGRGRVERQQQ